MTRGMVALATALVLSVLAHFSLSSSPGDGLRGTLVVLPLVVAALMGLGQWTADRGGRRAPAPVVTGEVAVLATIILIVLGRRHLGLPPGAGLERCLAAGLVLLLAHRVLWLVRMLRTALESGLPERPPWPFFALPFVVYLAILPWTSVHHLPDGDEPHYLLLTHSLAYDFDTDLRNNYEQGDSLRFMARRLEPQFGDPVGGGGRLYSRHNMLLPLTLAPLYRLGGLAGALLMMVAFAAATCWLTLALAYHYAPDSPDGALVAWAILAFTAPMVLFSYQVWVEVPAAMLILLALQQIHRLSIEKSGWRPWLQLAATLALLPLLKIRFLLIAAPLAVLAVWRAEKRMRKRAALLIGALLILGVGILVFNQQVFHNPLKYHDIDGLRIYTFPASQYGRGLLGLFFDCAFGLFSHAPIWMLLLPATALMLFRRSRLLVDFAVIFLPYLLLLSPRGEWFGAWSPPFRYGIVILPLLSLWLIPLLAGRHRTGGRFVVALLATLTLSLTVLWVVEPGWTFNLAHGRSHLLDQLSTRLMADVARFFPSAIRWRTASFIAPPVALVVVCLLWWSARRGSLRPVGLWGVSAALLLPALVAWAAQNRATRIVEFEDPWLDHRGGGVHPEQWVIYRPRYRGGWSLADGDSIRVPIVTGGHRVDLAIDVYPAPYSEQTAALEVRDGEDRVLDRANLALSRQWTSITFEDLTLAGVDSLILVFRGPSGEHVPRYSATLDRAFLTWE